MSDALVFLWPPFLVAVCLVGIHAYFGIQVLARKVIFVDLALAQIAALGATVAFMLGHPAQSFATYGYSLAFTLLAAVLLAFTRAWGTRVPQEALIGVIYVVAAAAAILLIDRAPQGAEHLKQILTGNILTSGLTDVAAIVPLYAAIGLLHWLLRGRLTGAGALIWEFVFYASFGVVVTSSVAIAGVLLVFSFLIIPAAIGVMFASSLARQLAIGWTAGIVTSAAGLAASFAFDLPTGAAMVCAFGASLALAGLLYPFLRGTAEPRCTPRSPPCAGVWRQFSPHRRCSSRPRRARTSPSWISPSTSFPRCARSISRGPSRRLSRMPAPMRSATAPRPKSSTSAKNATARKARRSTILAWRGCPRSSSHTAKCARASNS